MQSGIAVTEAEVIIVGGGPAGSSCARELGPPLLPDPVRGRPIGHFVVIYGIEEMQEDAENGDEPDTSDPANGGCAGFAWTSRAGSAGLWIRLKP